jgi:hypothetical protein
MPSRKKLLSLFPLFAVLVGAMLTNTSFLCVSSGYEPVKLMRKLLLGAYFE